MLMRTGWYAKKGFVWGCDRATPAGVAQFDVQCLTPFYFFGSSSNPTQTETTKKHPSAVVKEWWFVCAIEVVKRGLLCALLSGATGIKQRKQTRAKSNTTAGDIRVHSLVFGRGTKPNKCEGQ